MNVFHYFFKSMEHINIFNNKPTRWISSPVRNLYACRTLLNFLLFIGLSAFLTGCSAVFSSATSRLADNLSYAFENQTDIAVVEKATPAYLLMLDALIKDDPENASLLRTAAKLNAAYADIFVEDIERSGIITDKALNLAFRSACAQSQRLCGIREKSFEEFKRIIDASKKKEMDSIYALGVVWAGWIQANQNDWNAVAELPRVEAIMEKVVKLDPGHEDGGAFLYLGALSTLVPPALGGNPEKGREYFEKAIELSGGKNLYAKVLYAQRYARIVFDKELHDRLLREAYDANPVVEGYTLINIIARKEAKLLLDTSDDYFLEP